MKEALHRFGAEFLGEDAGQGDAQAIGENGDGNSGEDDEPLFPPAGAEKVGHENAENNEGEEVSKAGTGIHHLKLGKAKINDVAVLKCGHAEKAHDLDADGGGDEFEVKGDAVVEKIGEGEHGQRQHQGKKHGFDSFFSHIEPHQTNDNAPERDVLGKKLSTKLT